ncbi:RnfH family protein [Cellvibrio sp. KY-GH-1]|uniref:RnfH family protein n=1 Tax=Cellvibrio sp. KY-GH-1 TaxID=2303332 RepID=UPI0012478F1B|nr:RnfH family protein [Cellvibrio sp. KY-GH-1]QEY17248.1 RnfH family protein [Cellvibrio sp. KY-GH-1]
MADFDLITVEVAYALPHKQKIIALLVEPGTTALDAVKRSKITDHFPDLDIASAKMGIFGQSLGTKGLEAADKHVLHAGDRVEIYRPLASDPKEARRKRADKAADATNDNPQT